MIKKKCFTREWYLTMSRLHKYNDIGIIEKVVRAYSLLDLLSRSGCPYIFKGGTSVCLILGERTHRLSIDIDIICPPDTDIEKYLGNLTDYGFNRVELVERRNAGNEVPKSHSKFFYQISYLNRADQESYILLDVLYEDTHYAQVNEVNVMNQFIELEDAPSKVKVPSVGDILGDKLTAFAPNTTGIPYYKKGDSKATEIMKQAYDIGRLFDAIENLTLTTRSFNRISLVELGYRSLGTDRSIIFEDIRNTALLLATRGKEGKGDFMLLQDGVKKLGNFIYENKYFIEDAIIDSAKAAYIATCIELGVTEIMKYENIPFFEDDTIGCVLSTRLNKLKKTNPEAFFYWLQIDRLLNEKAN